MTSKPSHDVTLCIFPFIQILKAVVPKMTQICIFTMSLEENNKLNSRGAESSVYLRVQSSATVLMTDQVINTQINQQTLRRFNYICAMPLEV